MTAAEIRSAAEDLGRRVDATVREVEHLHQRDQQAARPQTRRVLDR